MASAALGLERNGADLASAVAAFLPIALDEGAESDPAVVALMVAVAAWQRAESRGAHLRSDFPRAADIARRSRLALSGALVAAHELVDTSMRPLAWSA
jgi:L-aspartate oxidase